MAAGILQLPPELLVRVASFLTTVELCPLRCACKHIEASLFDSFAQEFFTKRQFMIEAPSLEALVGIANHPGLAAKLSEVIISTHDFEGQLIDNIEEWLRSGWLPHETFVATGTALNLLVEIFSKLPNLRVVGVRDYEAAGRQRDGLTARWRPWGWSKGGDVVPQPKPAHPTFPLVLSALATAGRARPESIQLLLRHHRLDILHGLSPFGVTGRSIGNHLENLLDGLTSLMLHLSADTWNLPQPDINEHMFAPWKGYDESNIVHFQLARLLYHTPNLHSLRLNFVSRQFFASRFLEWLGRSASSTFPALMGSTVPSLALENLKTLEFGMTNVSMPVLVKVLTKWNLTSFSLWKVTLQCPVPVDTLDCWSAFFRELASLLPDPSNLRSVMLGELSQCHYVKSGNWRQEACYFVPEGTSPEDKAKIQVQKEPKTEFKRQFTALTPQEWLARLMDRTFLRCIHDKSDPEVTSLDSEESEWEGDEAEESD